MITKEQKRVIGEASFSLNSEITLAFVKNITKWTAYSVSTVLQVHAALQGYQTIYSKWNDASTVITFSWMFSSMLAKA